MNLYDRVRDLCYERDITVKFLEQQLCFSESTISKWGKSIPSADKLDKVAEYFNVSIQYLLGRTSEKGLYLPEENIPSKGQKELVERIKQLAIEKGISLAQLEKKLGFGNGSINKWTKSTPSGDKLLSVADYFNVSTDYLLGRSNSRQPIQSELTDKEEKDVAKTMRKLREQLISEQGLMFDGEVLDKETAQLLLEAIEQQERTVKIINRKYTRKDYRK